ncbi:MAG: NADPH:quinone reductase, partial [Alphaproteobacteria bacterium]|jgi:NADPH:quinone reductase-like Zn-dependent oxidoreductase
MRAVWYEENGAAADVLRLGEMDKPAPGPGELRVALATSGVNPVDCKRRRGGRGAMDAPRVVPHFDGAGLVDALGDGVDEARRGERVWIYEAQWGSANGSAADYVTLAADRAIKLPDSVGFDAGACLGIPAMTAHRCVFADGPIDGQTILVTGGAGAVGRYALQFAALGGARVIATVSSAEKAAVAKAAGAPEILDYKTEDVAARVAEITGGAGVDRIVEVEFGGNLESSLAVIANNGVIASYASDAVLEPTLPFYRMVYGNTTLRPVLVFGMPEAAKSQAVADITRWAESGDLSHHIGPRFSLEDTAAAHQAVEDGSFGKVIIEIAAL